MIWAHNSSQRASVQSNLATKAMNTPPDELHPGLFVFRIVLSVSLAPACKACSTGRRDYRARLSTLPIPIAWALRPCASFRVADTTFPVDAPHPWSYLPFLLLSGPRRTFVSICNIEPGFRSQLLQTETIRRRRLFDTVWYNYVPTQRRYLCPPVCLSET